MGFGFRVKSSKFKVQSSRVQGSGFQVLGFASAVDPGGVAENKLTAEAEWRRGKFCFDIIIAFIRAICGKKTNQQTKYGALAVKSLPQISRIVRSGIPRNAQCLRG